jgi:hypothetical protein
MEARHSLQLLLADLARDSSEFASVRRSMEGHAAAAAWLTENWDRVEVPTDSVEERLYSFSERSVLELSRSAYSGLENANRLRLLDPDSLRMGVLQYYQVSQESIRSWYADIHQLVTRLHFERLGRHVINRGGEEPGVMWPPIEQTLTLRTSWAELTADAELHNVLINYGRLTEYFAGNKLAPGEAAVGELMAQIRREL